MTTDPGVPWEDPSRGVAETEELRELLLSQYRELTGLRVEVTNNAILLDALRALLNHSHHHDPFAETFAVLARVFHFSYAVVLVEQQDSDTELACVAATEEYLTGTAWPRHTRLDAVLAGRVIATVAPNPDAAWPDVAMQHGFEPLDPALYLPLGFRGRRGLMMLVRSGDQDGFSRSDVALAHRLSLLASQALAVVESNRSEQERRRLDALTSELRRARDRLAYRANHDELTGLANRPYLEQEVASVIAAAGPGDSFALIFVDLDGFKQVNDNYGHDIGDELLIAVGRRIRDFVDDGDLVARISGDEFMILAHVNHGHEHLMNQVHIGLREIQQPLPIRGRQLLVSGSIGVAWFPEHGRDYAELRRHADLAMYSAKATARGSAAVFDPQMEVTAVARIEAEQELRYAVGERHFRAALQPKVDLRTMRIVGFEALARQLADDGTAGTSAGFIGLATALGLLGRITDIVIDDVIERLPHVDAVFGSDCTVSLNLSTTQATDISRVSALIETLAGTGHPERFIVEVTEDALLQHDVFHHKILPMFASAHIKVSIDDFGSGYATLSRLLNITADEIKIDRAFVTDIHARPRTQVIVQAIDTIGAEFHASIVAEGIETREELDFIRSRSRVTIGQGYLFARPALPEHLIARYDELQGHLASLRSSGR